MALQNVNKKQEAVASLQASPAVEFVFVSEISKVSGISALHCVFFFFFLRNSWTSSSEDKVVVLVVQPSSNAPIFVSWSTILAFSFSPFSPFSPLQAFLSLHAASDIIAQYPDVWLSPEAEVARLAEMLVNAGAQGAGDAGALKSL